MNKGFRGNGKLLLTGEYAVLDGAKALAIPTTYGQELRVCKAEKNRVYWKSYDHKNQCWFEDNFRIVNGKFSSKKKDDASKHSISQRLQQIFEVIFSQNSQLFETKGYAFESFLEFPQNWGLGSSSTLIYNLAQWASVNPYELLRQTFGGSGYDIACAGSNSPLIYQLENGIPQIKPVTFNPSFSDELFFVHLNKKQNSRKAIQHYKACKTADKKESIAKISEFTEGIIEAATIQDFEELVENHEQLLSVVLNSKPVKQKLFPDYPRTLKSLGAWGGDFILATGTASEKKYFSQKGYTTILNFRTMRL